MSNLFAVNRDCTISARSQEPESSKSVEILQVSLTCVVTSVRDHESLQPFPVKLPKVDRMSWAFLPVPSGAMDLELSQDSTVPGEVPEVEEECTPTVIEVESSADEVEVVPKLEEKVEVPTVEEEIAFMIGEEKFGQFLRLQDRDRRFEERLKDARKFYENEDPQTRKARRTSFQEAIHGKFK